jgi:hypothetical protein
VNDFELSEEAYTALHPRRSAVRRSARRALGRFWPIFYSAWKARWLIVSVCLVVVMWFAMSKWELEDEAPRPHHIHSVR